MTKDEALERKAENARELGLDYEPWEKFCNSNCVWTNHHLDCKLAQQEHGWTQERLAGMARLKAQQDKQFEPQRTWVGLTDDDRVLIKHDANYNQFMTAGEYAERVQLLTEARLKDKNT